jgi:hypothetical protein
MDQPTSDEQSSLVYEIMFGFRKKKIPIKRADHGSHGDHWGAVFGFGDEDHLAQSVNKIVEDLSVEAVIRRNVARLRSSDGEFSVFGIGTNDDLTTLYPGLDVTESIPVDVKEIVEWSHVGGIEAQIRGVGRDTFGLDFFALDYVENKGKYESGGQHQIGLAGLAYVLDAAGEMPPNFSDEMCAYLPNTDMPCGHDFNFIGDVLSVEDMSVHGEDLKLLRVKLINDDQHPEMFNLPLLVNQKNIRCSTVSVGDKVSGCFWLQGRIVDD